MDDRGTAIFGDHKKLEPVANLTEDMFTFVAPKDAQKIDFIGLTSGGMSLR